LESIAVDLEREVHRMRGYGAGVASSAGGSGREWDSVSTGGLSVAHSQMKHWKEGVRADQWTSGTFRNATRRAAPFATADGPPVSGTGAHRKRKQRRPADPIARYSPLVDMAVSPLSGVLLLFGVFWRQEEVKPFFPTGSALSVSVVDQCLHELEQTLKEWLYTAAVTPTPWFPMVRQEERCETEGGDGVGGGGVGGAGGAEEEERTAPYGTSIDPTTTSTPRVLDASYQLRLELRRVKRAREALAAYRQRSPFGLPLESVREALHLINEAVWGDRLLDDGSSGGGVATLASLANVFDVPRFHNGRAFSSTSSCTSGSAATSFSGWTTGSSSVASGASLLSSPVMSQQQQQQQRSPHSPFASVRGSVPPGWWGVGHPMALDMNPLSICYGHSANPVNPVKPTNPANLIPACAAMPLNCLHTIHTAHTIAFMPPLGAGDVGSAGSGLMIPFACGV
jgi:hypothetical protein